MGMLNSDEADTGCVKETVRSLPGALGFVFTGSLVYEIII